MDRIKVNREEGNFFMMYNEAFRDESLSLKARGLLATIMSLPKKWDFSIDGIASILKEGKTAIYTAIDELIEQGYCVRVEMRDNGKFTGNEYHFAEKKGGADAYKPHQENPNAGNPNSENPPQYNIEKNKISTESNTLSKHKEKKPKLRYAEYVCMTEKDYQKLVTEYGEPATQEFIKILNNYKGSKGKAYKNDYLAILSWVVDRYKENKSKSPAPAPVPQKPKKTKWEEMGLTEEEYNKFIKG